MNIFLYSSSPTLLKIDNSSINPYPRTSGVVTVDSFESIVISTFPRVYRGNPRTKLLCVLDNYDESSIRELLKVGFDKYKFLDNAVMIRNSEFNFKKEENKKITTFCVYDPFEKEGIVTCKNMTKSDYKEKMREFLKIADDRSKNLKGFPLRVGKDFH